MLAGITREIAAHHEAGHAVVALVCDVPVRYASIKPLKKTWGPVAFGAGDSEPEPEVTMIVSFSGAVGAAPVCAAIGLVWLRRYGFRE